jgi:hypothetical protein
MVGIAAFAAIAFIRRRLSGHATLELIRATFVSALPAVPTVVQRPLHGLAEWARHARTEPGEAAELWYRGTVGPIAPCLRPRRSQREAAAARCHSCVHSVWDRKKGRCIRIVTSENFGPGRTVIGTLRDPQVRWLFTPFDAPADIILDPCRSPHGGRLKDPTTRGRAHGPSACPRLGPSISA